MEDTIFTKIIKGEIPCHKIYEDESTFAFLDIHPKTQGHVLVISKKQVEFVWDLEDEDYVALMRTVNKMAARIKEVMGKPYVGEMIIGVDIPHAHVHVFPFSTMEEYSYRPDMTLEPDHTALGKIADKLKL
jgi:histidine triad (HIT) family protein